MQASYKGELMLRSLQSFIQPAMFDLEIEVTRGGEAGKVKIFTPPILPLVQFLFSPQPSAVIKLKEGGHNFP